MKYLLSLLLAASVLAADNTKLHYFVEYAEGNAKAKAVAETIAKDCKQDGLKLFAGMTSDGRKAKGVQPCETTTKSIRILVLNPKPSSGVTNAAAIAYAKTLQKKLSMYPSVQLELRTQGTDLNVIHVRVGVLE